MTTTTDRNPLADVTRSRDGAKLKATASTEKLNAAKEAVRHAIAMRELAEKEHDEAWGALRQWNAARTSLASAMGVILPRDDDDD